MPENLYKRNGTWYARIKADGREYRKSLRTDSLTTARKKLKQYMDGISATVREGEVIWSAAIVEWHKRVEVRQSTYDRYTFSLSRWQPYLEGLYLSEITRSALNERIALRKTEGVGNATIRRDLTAISSVLEVAIDNGWIESNPAKDLASRIKERRDPIVLPRESDIDYVVERAPGNFANAIRFAQHTGMREEEVFSMTWAQVRGGKLDIPKTKTNKPRSIELNEKAEGTLKGTEKKAKCPYVFWHGDGQRYHNVASQFLRISGIAARDAEKAKKPFVRFRFHDLRHWHAVNYLRTGGSIYTLQKNLGHASIKTTEIYLNYLTPEETAVAQKGAQE